MCLERSPVLRKALRPSAAPNDAVARANVLEAAATLALAFNQTSAQISQVSTDATQQAYSTAVQVNELTAHIASLNATIQKGAQNDAGLAADLNNSLESLSMLINVSVTMQTDGSASVLLDGQTPLTLGSTSYALAVKPKEGDAGAPYPNGDAGLLLVDQNGRDISGQASKGKLGALLQIRNHTVPFYLGNQAGLGELNNLAKSLASRVNTILTAAQTSVGVTVAPLFAYDLSDDTRAAASLLTARLGVDQVVAGDGVSSNGVATELANINNPSDPADLMSNGQTFTAFYALLAGHAGASASQAADDLQAQENLTAQAQNQRKQASGVSLNDQAAQLMSLQQAYQATARIITILNNLSQTVVNILPQA